MKNLVFLLCLHLGVFQVTSQDPPASKPGAKPKQQKVKGLNDIQLHVDLSKFDLPVDCDNFKQPTSCPCTGQPEHLICSSNSEQFTSYCEFFCHWKCNKQLLRIDGNCSVPRVRLDFKKKEKPAVLARAFNAIDKSWDSNEVYDYAGDPAEVDETFGRNFQALPRAVIPTMG